MGKGMKEGKKASAAVAAAQRSQKRRDTMIEQNDEAFRRSEAER